MSDNGLSRRDFLSTTGAAATGLALTSLAERASGAANEKLAVGIVGPGGRGRGLMKTFFDEAKGCDAEMIAVCDLWNRNRDRAADAVKQASGKEPKAFKRLEDMLAMKGLDAVIIATADHAHAQQ